jgi:hypothetical protein
MQANIRRAVDGTAKVIPMPVQGIVLVSLDGRTASVPTARAYQLLHTACLPGITARDGTPAWRWQCRQVASALLGDWQ